MKWSKIGTKCTANKAHDHYRSQRKGYKTVEYRPFAEMPIDRIATIMLLGNTEFVERDGDIKKLYEQQMKESPKSAKKALFLEGLIVGMATEARRYQKYLRDGIEKMDKAAKIALVDQIEEELKRNGIIIARG